MAYVVDGKEYEKETDIPDLASWECVGVDANGCRQYYGKSIDYSKLPKYDDLKTGSTAYCVDNGTIYMYYSKDKSWIEQ